LNAEEYTGIGLEEDSSCQQFARLEQQIYAKENHNRSSSHTTAEVAVVSITQKN